MWGLITKFWLEFTLGIMAALITSLFSSIKKERKKHKDVENGLKSLLRTELIRSYEKYSFQGFCPIYAKEALTYAYEAYHDLGGNGTMTKLYDEIMCLPSAKQEKKEVII